MKDKIALLNFIRKTIAKEAFTVEEEAIVLQARQAKEASGLGHFNLRQGFSLPMSLGLSENDPSFNQVEKRDILTQAYLIGRKQQYLINPIDDQSVFLKAGALFLQTEFADIDVPSFSGIQASWVDDETDPDSDGDEITISGAQYKNKRMYVCLDIPEKLIHQGGEQSEIWLRDAITAALAAKIDSTLGGITASGTNKPQGMGYAVTTGATTKRNAVVPGYEAIVEYLEEAVNGLYVPIENYSFITTPGVRRALRNAPYLGGDPVFKDGKILDYPAHISNRLSTAAGADGLGELILFGNWKDLAIIQFGAYDIVPDPYTLKLKGKIQLHVNAYFDMKGLKGSQTTGEGTEENQYATSFAALAIKTS